MTTTPYTEVITSPAADPAFAPPRFADPRRLGALVGLAGACTFVLSYAEPLDDVVALVATITLLMFTAASLLLLFALPRWLGEFLIPRTSAILTYLACVAGEIGLIWLGTTWLESIGRAEARPALIAFVVGLHFVPFSWAFGEPMFRWLGGGLALVGAVGFVAGLAGVPAGASGAAVLGGLVMAAAVLAYASGAFAEPAPKPLVRVQE